MFYFEFIFLEWHFVISFDHVNAGTWYAQLMSYHINGPIRDNSLHFCVMHMSKRYRFINLILCAPGVAGQDPAGPHSSSFAGIDASRERDSLRYGAAVMARRRQDKQNPSSFRGPSFRTQTQVRLTRR